MKATKKELEALYKSFDADKNGSLDFSEVSKPHVILRSTSARAQSRMLHYRYAAVTLLFTLFYRKVSKLHANLTGAASKFETSAAARHVIERSKLFRRRAALIHAALVAEVAEGRNGEMAGRRPRRRRRRRPSRCRG